MPEQTTSGTEERSTREEGFRDFQSVAEAFNARNPGEHISEMAARSIHNRAIEKLRRKLAKLMEDSQ